MKRMPTVALVGRVNVGKSTLLNRLVEERKAIVSPIPGTTRDWMRADCLWRGQTFTLVDTGGLEPQTTTEMEEHIRAQTLNAAREADMLLLVLDGEAGIVPTDTRIARMIRSTEKPVLVAVNKADRLKRNPDREAVRADVLRLGFGEPQFVSARSGEESGNLLDAIYAKLPMGKANVGEVEFSLAIIGKPNVGKSTLMNALAGTARVITSPEPHTTRDPQEHLLSFEKHALRLIDTAGIRKRARERNPSLRRQGGTIEEESITKSVLALKRADIAVLLLDMSEPITAQDMYLAGQIIEERKGLILGCNKWDTIPKKTPSSVTQAEQLIRRRFPFAAWAPVIFLSALQKNRIRDILLMALRIRENMNRTASKEVLDTIVKNRRFPLALPLKSLIQTGTNPPRFEAVFGGRDGIPVSLQRTVVNRIRETLDFTGSPVILHARQPLRR